jgi:glycosyltransferase involved in cell wall biosynthesis
MSVPMRIAEMVGHAHAGRWMDPLLAGFKARGHEVALLLPGEGPLADRARAMGISIHFRPLPNRHRGIRYIESYTHDVAQWLREFRADVAHMHLFPGAFWARLAAWRARVPVRATQWPGPAPLEFFLFRQMDNATAWMDTALIGGCRWVEEHYRKSLLTRHKAFCVHYPFDTSAFDPTLDGTPIRDELGIPRDALVISLIAYMYIPLSASGILKAPRHLLGGGIKGHEILIQAVPKVLQQRPDAYFLIVGDVFCPESEVSYPAALRRMAAKLDVGNHLIFTGFRKDVARILAATDIAVVPSLTENLGGAVEPFLMEKPVVASRVGGLPDVVQDGETGILVPPRNPTALADTILQMANVPPETRREWGRRGRQKTLDLCGPDRCVCALEKIFQGQLRRGERQS